MCYLCVEPTRLSDGINTSAVWLDLHEYISILLSDMIESTVLLHLHLIIFIACTFIGMEYDPILFGVCILEL